MAATACLVLLGCDRGAERSEEAASQAEPSAPLSTAERERLQVATMAGDRTAARRLAQFYSLSHGDQRDRMHWLSAAANTGSDLAVDRYAFYVKAYASAEDCARAKTVLAHLQGFRDDLAVSRPTVEKLQRALSHNRTCRAAG